ncbi:MAG TPA: hypothetical protein VIJ46_04820 [Rhabdochlamydiaceae bacterium]
MMNIVIVANLQMITATAVVASAVALFAIIMGFFPPTAGTVQAAALYPFLLIGGIGIVLSLPFLFLKLAKK